jgi:hypothetical protein
VLESGNPSPAPAQQPQPHTRPGAAPADAQASRRAPASIAGHVTDREGNGIPGAVVELAVLHLRGRAEQVVATFSTAAGDDGAYRFAEILPAGGVRLTAGAEGFVRLDSGWPSVPGSPELRLIEEGGAYENVDFRLARAAGYIGGAVVDGAHAGIPGARVEIAKQLGPEDSQGWYYGISGEGGHFRIAVPGTDVCMLTVRKAGYGAGYFPEIYPGMEDLELVLEGGGAVFGRVSDTQGNSIAGTTVLVMGEKSPGILKEEWEAPGTVETTTGPDGFYRVEDLSARFTYTIRAPYPVREQFEAPKTSRSLDDFLLKLENNARDVDELQFGGVPSVVMAQQKNVAVRAGADTRVDLVAQQAGLLPSAICGRVTDTATGKPVCPVMVYALCDSPGLNVPLVGMAATQRDGTYRMQFIGLPATLTLSIRTDYCTKGQHRSFEGAPEVARVRLAPGEERELNFTVSSTVTAPVRTVTAEGVPVPGVEIGPEVSDAQGRMTLYGLEPNVTHVLVAYEDVKDAAGVARGHRIRGRSAPFSGKPGETVPEVSVVCSDATGALQGRVIAPGVDFEEENAVACTLHYADGGMASATAFLDAEGAFYVDRVSTGACELEVDMNFSYDRQARRWVGLTAKVPGVEILPDRVTEVGAIPLEPTPE